MSLNAWFLNFSNINLKESSVIHLGAAILVVLSEATKPFVIVFLNLMKSFFPWPPSSSSTMPNFASALSQGFFSKVFCRVMYQRSISSVVPVSKAWLGLHNYFSLNPSTRHVPQVTEIKSSLFLSVLSASTIDSGKSGIACLNSILPFSASLA